MHVYFSSLCKRCVDLFMTALPTNSEGEKHCPDDGDEIYNEVFNDNSALKEILQLECYCLKSSEGCPWTGRIMSVEEHLNECGFNRIDECPYARLGCDFKATSVVIKQHMTNEMMKHGTLKAVSVMAIKKNYLDPSDAIVKSFDEKVRKFENSKKKYKSDIDNFQKDIEEFEKEISEEDRFDDQKSRLKKLEESDFVKLKEKYKQLNDHVHQAEELVKLVKASKDTTEKATFEKRINTLSEKTRRLVVSHKANNTAMQRLSLKARLYQSTTFDGTFMWKLDDLRNRFTEAVSGKVTELFTPPLYTSRYGYKFSAKILLNGEKRDRLANRPPHVALYIVLLKGDYDEVLPFPFPFPIKITLINAGKNDDIVHRLIPDDKVHFQKPTRELNPAIGFAQFCSHESLYSKGFVKEDSIFIKIQVETDDDSISRK